MSFDNVLELLAFIFLICIPVLAVTTRLLLGPLIRDVVGAIRGVGQRSEEDYDHRLSRLEDAVLEQGQQMDRLIEAELFRRRLEVDETNSEAGAAAEHPGGVQQEA